MDVFNIFNKASEKINSYFSFIENKINNQKTSIQDSLIQINSKIFIWIKDSNFHNDDFIKVIHSNFRDNYMIYNLLPDKIDTNIFPDKIIDFKLPNNPSFSLEFLISFCISSKNWLNAMENNILVIHDDLTKNDGNIFYLISTIIIYNNKSKNKDEIKDPVDIYNNLLLEFQNNKNFQKYSINANAINNIRYLNYFSSIQKSPLITLKKLFLNSVTIMGAPAIDNDENKDSTHYITINKNSYYIPVIRIKSNGKYIYSSYNPKNNKENINKLEKIFYSNENGINFDVNQTCFNDVCIEVMHKGEKTFRLLFIIQFNTFFISNNFSIKFDKEHIDSINQDIRYPNNFCLELNFDGSKEEKLSPFDEYSITWKTMLSEFIVKGLSKNKENNNIINQEKKAENKIENKNENININNKEMINENKKEEINKENKKENDEENIVIDTEIKKDKEKKEENAEGIVEKKEEIIKKEIKEDKDEDILNTIGNTNNTLNQVNDLLKKIEGNNDNEKEEENEDDEDIENYLKNLENK
jgi:hypothetical protein